jgi:hypothetical protein
VNLPPTVKYTLGRIGLFVLVFLAMLLVPGMSLLLKLMIAILASFGLQFVLLGRWRREMIDYIDGSVQKSKADKAKLRAALAGDEPAPSRARESAGRPEEAGEPPAPGVSDPEQGNAEAPRPGQSAE